MTMSPAFFPTFEALDVAVPGARLHGVVGGDGPPVVLLHGYPQTHVAWRRIAPGLASAHRVVVPDLPGYGDSRVDSMQPRWTKRRVAAAIVDLMRTLGHERFAIVGHDRGARVGYRLALDHPAHVVAYVSLAVVPTLDAMEAVDRDFALKNFHWFLLAQEADLPERLLAADPDLFIERALAAMAGGLANVEPAALEAYRTAFRNPSVQQAICEDYRAAMDEDLAADRADRDSVRRLACPVHVLWPAAAVRAGQPTPCAVWARWADAVSGAPLDCGHLIPEDAPDAALAAMRTFLGSFPPQKGRSQTDAR